MYVIYPHQGCTDIHELKMKLINNGRDKRCAFKGSLVLL